MNNLFPYTTPDPGRQKALKQMLLKEHRRLYGQEKVSFFSKYKVFFMSPLYALLFLTLGLGSIFSVQAVNSPVAQVYGEIYGFSAQFQVGIQQTLATLNLAPVPVLPGLSSEETNVYMKTQNAGQKALLSSKIGRALPADLQDKILIPSDEGQQITHKNDLTLSLTTPVAGTIVLSWKEQYLPSGALPSKYIIERSIGSNFSWEKIGEQTDTVFTDTTAAGNESVYYRIKSIDWQETALKEILSASRPAQAASSANNIPATSPANADTTAKPVVPIMNTNKNSNATAPAYDFADETQPLINLQLKVVPELKTSSQFKLSWKAASLPNTRGYNIYRDNIKRNVSLLRNTNFTDSDVKAGKAYQYQIRAVSEDGTEIGKSIKVQTTFPFIPGTPINIEGQLINNTVSLQWKSVAATDLKGYVIYKKDLSTGQETLVRTQTNSFTDKALSPGTSYQYTVASELTSGIQSARSISVQISSP